MANLAIRGHINLGWKVIKTLEMLGGVNTFNLEGNTDKWYVLEGDRVIRHGELLFVEKGFTLEEFFEKFPYKIGDRVRVPEYESEVCISKMYWDGSEVQYEVVTDEVEWYSAKELNEFNEPSKEENMGSKPNLFQRLKEYFDNTPRDVLEKEWNELSHLNEIGPTVDEYLECVKKYRQSNQYPKTYEECEASGFSSNPVIVATAQGIPITTLAKLIVIRNEYWKIYGEQIGLGKPWKPDWKNVYENHYTIVVCKHILKTGFNEYSNRILIFPTEEMRDAFYKHFKDLIEQCKELL